jgi:hypothetical protein
MQFMLLMIPKGYETAKPGTAPDAARVAEMMKFNQALSDAGVLVTLNGLHPVSAGARVSFAGGKPTVVDGPFVETKEALGGYWVIRVKSKDEAIEWAKRCPATENETIEIRQIQEMEDFPADVQKAAEGFTALRHAAGQYVDGFLLPVPKAKVEEYPREERDRINALVMKDPRLDMDPAHMPFDAKRMIFGGFNVLVEA